MAIRPGPSPTSCIVETRLLPYTVAVSADEAQRQWREALVADAIDPVARALEGPREIDLYPRAWRGMVRAVAGSLCEIETTTGEIRQFNARNNSLRVEVLSVEAVATEHAAHLKREAERAEEQRLATVPELRRLTLSGSNGKVRVEGEQRWRPLEVPPGLGLWEGQAGESRSASCTLTHYHGEVHVVAWVGEVEPAPAPDLSEPRDGDPVPPAFDDVSHSDQGGDEE